MKPILASIALACWSAEALGQSATRPASAPAAGVEEKGPRIIRLTVRPAAEARPALRYRLLPTAPEREAGNAAALYHIAIEVLPDNVSELDNRMRDWLEVPPADLPLAEARKALSAYHAALRQVQLAAFREHCDWDLPVRSEGFNLLMPHLSGCRRLARALALKGRLEIAEGRREEALKTIKTGLAMARQTAQGSFLVGDLVGMSTADVMLDQAQELIQVPEAPNFYWALADLPRPFIDLREAMEWEGSMTYLNHPELRDPRSARLSPGEWRNLMTDLTVTASQVTDTEREKMRLSLVVAAIQMYPRAKRYLVQTGVPEQEVEAMPVHQALAVYSLEEYWRWRDDLFKLFSLPYWQAHDRFREWERAFMTVRVGEGRANPFFHLLPALDRAVFYQARLDRRIAVLRVIEAVRAYAAGHDGAPPPTLEALRVVPLPNDPVTGRPFAYEATADGFIIDARAPSGFRPDEGWYRYVVTIRK